eukprot:Nk52_evm11s163 gene=Nk52_evmTU11s163
MSTSEPAQIPEWLSSEHMTGTTIMAVEYDGGVVIGADSRTTTGAYIANRVTDKLTVINDRIYCCRSGSAADTQAVAAYVQYYLDLHSVSLGVNERPRVKTAANMFHQICYGNRDHLTAGIICAGWDEKEGGQVYTIPLGGMLIRQPFSIGGSGSTYIYGFCDAQYRIGMSREDCFKFVSSALALAMARDGSSGGMIRMASISEGGVERRNILGDQLPRFNEL